MHCVTCHQHFANPRACDTHIGHDGVHLDPATATRRDGRPRFVARNRPFGLTWSLAFYGEIPANFGRHVVEDGEGDDDLDPDYVIGTLSAEDDEGDGPAA